MINYDYDQTFLKLFEEDKNKIQFISIVVLDFQERPIREITGQVQSGGSINIDGTSSMRRTISFNMVAGREDNNLSDINNIISLNKKIKINIGYQNNLKDYKEKYGDIIWFKCGIFIICQASITHSLTGCVIAIQGKDKIVKLNGMCGGILPASVTFHEREETLADGSTVITYPTIYQIIQKAVNQFGEEPLTNIFINDLDLTAKLMVRYNGDLPISFHYSENGNINYFAIGKDPSTLDSNFWQTYYRNDDIGYFETDFTYPGELILNAGETVTTLLDKIINVLGNYEYFYDLDGHFIFQEKKNYLNKYYTPFTTNSQDHFFKKFSDTKYIYTFNDMKNETNINYNPSYENIKNDFIVWGSSTGQNGITNLIKYRLAIDKRPNLVLASQIMVKYETSLGNINYFFVPEYDKEKINASKPIDCKAILEYFDISEEWREELYRQALCAQAIGSRYSAYDEELLEHWRNIYNPSFDMKWLKTKFWNPDIYTNPNNLIYWLDFIDESSIVGKYSVESIGRRTIVINNDKCDHLFSREVNDILFLKNSDYSDEDLRNEKVEQLMAEGQNYCFYNENQSLYFTYSSTGVSAYDLIRESLYTYLTLKSTVTISSIPKFYLEPNNLIYLKDDEANINGEFVITQMNIPLSFNGIMTITATEAVSRI